MHCIRRLPWHPSAWASLVAAVLVSPSAQAGRECRSERLSTADVARAMVLAERTARELDASGARVVALARAGQDLRRWGLHYSHMAWAYREAPEAPGGLGRWRVVHKLNQCGTDYAAVYRQGLGEFFMDHLYRYEAGYVLPTAALQQQLLPVLRDNAQAVRWHARAYSMVAYPWSQRYQQSNQWAIETLAGAADPAAADRERAQSWLRLQGYVPATLRIDALSRLGARLTSANVAFDDHPWERRFTDRIDTTTVDSVFAWLAASGLGGGVHELR